jgi:CubicO group peptidase (beta-lactamase class C family)
MSMGGLSAARLDRMHRVMAGYVERGEVPGLITLIDRRGEEHVDVLGTLEAGGTEPVRRDTIFRISSMSKPITAVATMMLVEECRLRLDEPVDRLLPELANRRVLRRLDGPLDDTVPAERPVTVRDLLTFRWGFGQMYAPPDRYPVLKAANEYQIGMGPPNPASMPPPDEWMRRLGSLPLLHQPGELWMYHTGSDVLGVLIARVADQPLESFLRERVFEPLGMTDTAFSVPAEKLDRLATSYQVDLDTGALELNDPVQGGQWSSPPLFPSGGGGLVSTVDDYAAFGRMLLEGGRYGAGRLLSRPAVAAMTTDQLTPEQKAVSGFLPGYFETRGWGLGMSVVTGRTDVAAVPGQFGWDGGLGTSWFSDPTEDLVAILMTQRSAFPLLSPVYLDFWTSVYQAIDD